MACVAFRSLNLIQQCNAKADETPKSRCRRFNEKLKIKYDRNHKSQNATENGKLHIFHVVFFMPNEIHCRIFNKYKKH